MNEQNEQVKGMELQKIEEAIVQGNLANLNTQERLVFYKRVCESVGLNPLTKPFEYITLNNKLTLYATRSCTDQLRNLNKVSINIIDRKEGPGGLYIVTARASDASGRTDEAIGAIRIEGVGGEALANAIMKCETKAKRRATLSFCGLGFLDESEVEGAMSSSFRNTQANITEAVRPQIANTEEREALILGLEEVVKEHGLEGLSKTWKDTLTPENRKLIGAAELQRIKGLAIVHEEGGAS